MALDHGKGGNGVAQDVGTHQSSGIQLFEDDGGGEPGEEVGVGKPQEVREEPACEPVISYLLTAPAKGRREAGPFAL